LKLRQDSDAGTPAVDGPEAEAFANLADKLLEALKLEDRNAER
jgi:hypothetical protein